MIVFMIVIYSYNILSELTNIIFIVKIDRYTIRYDKSKLIFHDKKKAALFGFHIYSYQHIIPTDRYILPSSHL